MNDARSNLAARINEHRTLEICVLRDPSAHDWRDKIATATVVVLIITIGTVCLPFLWDEERNAHTQTIGICRQVLIASDLIEFENPSALATVGNVSSSELNRYVAELFPQFLDTHAFDSGLVSSEGWIVDAWGQRLEMCTTSDPVTESLNERLLGKKRKIIVWSSGENGINDFGFLDDVFSDF